MNPLTLHARNYRSFDVLDVDLPTGCVALLGWDYDAQRSNGSAKSSVVEAIELALFGECRTGRLPAQLTTGSPDELLLELELEHAGQLYRVRRTFSPRGRGKTTLDFERIADDAAFTDRSLNEWLPLTCESTKETQERIGQCIGLTRETFRASAFLAQGDGAAFTEAAPRDRKRILAEVLGLDRWETLLQRARADRQQLERQQAELAARTRQAEEAAAAKADLEREHGDVAEAETVAADNVADLERSHQELAVEYQAAREHAGRRTAAEAELREAERECKQLDDLHTRAGAARVLAAAARSELATLGSVDVDTLETRERELAELVATHESLLRDRDLTQRLRDQRDRERLQLQQRGSEEVKLAVVVDAKIAHLQEQHEATCETCGQTLPDEARAIAITGYREQADRHRLAGQRLLLEASQVEIPDVPAEPSPPPRDELATVRSALAAARAQETKRATLAERIRQAEATLAEIPADLDELTAEAIKAALAKRAAVDAIGEPPNLAAIERRGSDVAAQLKTSRTQLEQHKTQRARLEERLAIAAAAEATLAEHAAERDHLDASLDVVVALERAFSPNGIPMLIVESSAVPYLETEATRILAELGTSYRVELRTQAELKSGDGLRDTLDVVVLTETGERAYETFSGGERTRINLALRIALARLLAHRRGAESRLLCIDEPDGLDEQGMAALLEILRGLETDFDKLYVISHVPALRDSFDTTLTVEKRDGVSQIVGASVYAEAAA